MLSDQLEDYPGHARFVDALLGLRSFCEDFVRALQLEQPDLASCPAPALVDFALGVVSLHRTLHAVTTMPAPATRSLEREDESTPISEAERPRWLR
jgi:hypothetical protein